MVKNIDASSLKMKVSRKDAPEDNLADDLEWQLTGFTVEKPVLDADGNAIAWPGQMLDKEKIKAALRAGVLQEFLDLATVKLEPETSESVEKSEPSEEDLAQNLQENAEPELELEVEIEVAAAEEDDFVVADEIEIGAEEDEAFIAEEVAKMEAAEQA